MLNSAMATTIKLKNSVVKDKEPLPSNLEIGELAVGAHVDSPALFFKDSGDNIVKIAPGSAVDSVNGQTGVVVLNATDVGALAAGDNVSELANDAAYITLAEVPSALVSSVNTKTGDVVLNAADVGALDLAGGDLTGDLTLNTDKVTLDAGDGSITAAGNIQVAGFPEGGANDGAVLRSTGAIQASRSAGSTLWAGYKTGTNDSTSKIDSSGNAEFAGSITAAGNVLTGEVAPTTDTAGIELDSSGIVTVQRLSGVTSAAFQVFSGTNSSPTSQIKSDGNATFKGDVAIGTSATAFLDKVAVIAALTPEQRTTFATAITAWNNRPEPYDAEDPTTLPADIPLREAIVRATTAGKINLNSSGSAMLAGPINLGSWENNANSAVYMVNQANNGSIVVKGNGSSDIAFGVYKDGWSSSNAVARINANGTITAEGYSMASLAQL